MARQATLELIADASRLRSTLKQAEGDTDKFGAKMGGLGRTIAGALTGAAVIGFGKSAVSAFTESEQAQSKLELALKNSKATIGVQASEFAKLNTELAKHTLADDDVIAATEARMVTFGASKEQIVSMIPTVLDLAAKMGIDAPAAADLFDKASLGSVKALKTLGVEGYKPTGDKATDLANIQALLKDKVKGAAQAQLDAAGPGAKMKKSMDELQESVGKILVPALQTLAGIVSTVIDFFTNLSAPIKVAIGVAAALAAGVYLIVTAQKAWLAIQAALNIVMAMNPITLVVIAVAALVAALVLAYKNVGWFRDIVDAVFGWIGGFVSGAFDTIKNVITGVFDWVKNNWPLLLAILTGPVGLAVLAIITHWDTIKNAFTAVKDWIGERIGDIVGFITGIPGRIAGGVSTMWDGIKTAFTAVKDWLWLRLADIVGFYTGMPGRIGRAAAGMFDGIKDAFRGAVNWIVGQWNNLRLTLGGQRIDLPFGQGFTIPSVTLETPNLPYLHAGGVVPGRPGADVLAMLQAGERVVPAGAGTGGGGSMVVHLTVNGALDSAAVGRQIIDLLKAEIRRSGPVGVS